MSAEESEALRLVELRRLQLCAAALAYADESTGFDLLLAASRYAGAVRELRETQNREDPCTNRH